MEDNDYEKKHDDDDEKPLLKALLSKLSERLKILYLMSNSLIGIFHF